MTPLHQTHQRGEHRMPPQSHEHLNIFHEDVFAHSSNGTVLAVRPAHISLAEARSLGSIPATVRSWTCDEATCRVSLIIKDRARETVFLADLPAAHPLIGSLRTDMILYMRFAWDKVLEYQDSGISTLIPAAA